MADLSRRLAAETLGTAFLLAAVVGSGIMAQRLSGGNDALALLGAHMNPAVSIAFAFRRNLGWPDTAAYVAAQIIGAVIGVWVAHLMFELPMWQVSLHVRSGAGQWLAESVATFGLVLTIFGCAANAPAAVPFAVGLYITAAYWFTASTSFANPAVTIARALTDTFAGIAPAGVLAFIAAQLLGAIAAVALARWFWPWQKRTTLSADAI